MPSEFSSSSSNPYASSSSVPLSQSTRNILSTDYSSAGPSALVEPEEEEDVEDIPEGDIISSEYNAIEPTRIDEETLRYVNPEIFYDEDGNQISKRAYIKLKKRGRKPKVKDDITTEIIV
jgi:hypothetical protein